MMRQSSLTGFEKYTRSLSGLACRRHAILSYDEA